MPRVGFTLLELLVVLVILGLAATLVPVAWPLPVPGAVGASVADVVTTARRLALDRGEAVALEITGDGRWWIRTVAAGDTLRVGQVPVAATRSQVTRLRLDALGLCHPRGGPSSDSTYDMAACRMAPGAGDALEGARRP